MLVRPEQSKLFGPVAPHWYGLPIWLSAYQIASDAGLRMWMLVAAAGWTPSVPASTVARMVATTRRRNGASGRADAAGDSMANSLLVGRVLARRRLREI